ncbi:MAG: hypothetical protein KF859_06455 [Phycisphaeraceae bacterium]|nr:hypothetical protein [Phycisphaeraceae bacterium]
MRLIHTLLVIFWTAVYSVFLALHVIDRIWPSADIGDRLSQFVQEPQVPAEPEAWADAVPITISSVRLTEKDGGLHVELTIVNESDRRITSSVDFTSQAVLAILMNLTSKDGRVWKLSFPTNTAIRLQHDHFPREYVIAPKETINIGYFAPSVSIREKDKRHLPQYPPPVLTYSIHNVPNPDDVTDAQTGEVVVVKISGEGVCTYKRE